MASIRSKIVLTLVSALIVAGLVASWATYYSTRSEFSAIFDGQLKHTAEEIVETGSVDISHITLVGQSPKLKLFVQIYDAHENRFYMSQHRNPLPLAETVGFSNVTLASGEQWRQFTSTVGTRIIQVAQPTDVRDELAV